VAQKFRYWIVARHEGKNEQLLLENPLRIPIFTTSAQAIEFGGAVAQVMDKSLRVELWISKRKWPSRTLQYVEKPKAALFDPPISECQRAIFVKGRTRTIQLVRS
jgi:hypothetical protein